MSEPQSPDILKQKLTINRRTFLKSTGAALVSLAATACGSKDKTLIPPKKAPLPPATPTLITATQAPIPTNFPLTATSQSPVTSIPTETPAPAPTQPATPTPEIIKKQNDVEVYDGKHPFETKDKDAYLLVSYKNQNGGATNITIKVSPHIKLNCPEGTSMVAVRVKVDDSNYDLKQYTQDLLDNGIPVDLKGSFYRFINPKDGNQLIGGFAFLPEGVTFEDQSTDPTKPEFRRLNPKLKFFQNDIRTKNFLEVKDWKSTIPATVNLETVRTILNKRVEK